MKKPITISGLKKQIANIQWKFMDVLSANGVHFNEAIKHFKNKINTVHASYPLNIVNDFAGSYDTVQEA